MPASIEHATRTGSSEGQAIVHHDRPNTQNERAVASLTGRARVFDRVRIHPAVLRDPPAYQTPSRNVSRLSEPPSCYALNYFAHEQAPLAVEELLFGKHGTCMLSESHI